MTFPKSNRLLNFSDYFEVTYRNFIPAFEESHYPVEFSAILNKSSLPNGLGAVATRGRRHRAADAPGASALTLVFPP